MDRKRISEKLRELAGKAEYRSKAAQLRDVIEDIEAAMAKGVSRKAIVDELAKNGLAMPMSTFDSILLRHRRKRTSDSPKKRHAGFRSSREEGTTPESNEAQLGTFSPASLDNIINSTPDLAQYARMAKDTRRKKP